MDDLTLVRRTLARTPRKDLHDVEKRTKIPFDTLVKIKYGETINPGWTTVDTLAKDIRRQLAKVTRRERRRVKQPAGASA